MHAFQLNHSMGNCHQFLKGKKNLKSAIPLIVTDDRKICMRSLGFSNRAVTYR